MRPVGIYYTNAVYDILIKSYCEELMMHQITRAIIVLLLVLPKKCRLQALIVRRDHRLGYGLG